MYILAVEWKQEIPKKYNKYLKIYTHRGGITSKCYKKMRFILTALFRGKWFRMW